MSISERINNAINAIKALSDQNGGGSDTTKIDSDAECQKLSELLARTDLELTQEERDVILGLKVEYKSNKIHSQQEPLVVEETETQTSEGITAEYAAYDSGDTVRCLLRRGKQKGEITQSVNAYISQTNKDNVLDFLRGYYSDGKGHVEGIMEKMDDDNTDGAITMANKLKFLDSILAKAKDLGLENSVNYQEILTIKKMYTQNDSGFNKTYRKTNFWNFKQGKVSKTGSVISGGVGGAAVGVGIVGVAAGAKAGALTGSCFAPGLGTIIGAVVGAAAGVAIGLADRITDNEVLDEKIKALYEEMVQVAS